MEEKILAKLAKLDLIEKRLDSLEHTLENLDEDVKEVRNQQFLFEHEYGTKIDAIFDAVTMELDKNLEKSAKIRKLDARVDRCEANIFGHEKRISTLELNQ